MPHIVISGTPDCPNFVHAVHVARYLSEKLPNFNYKKVEKKGSDWARYIENLNKENNWFISGSPLIWREMNMWGGKKFLIGELAEFWEYVYCYYGLESLIPKAELRKLADDNMNFFLQEDKLADDKKKKVMTVSILGATCIQTNIIIDGLLEIEGLRKMEGISVKIWDILATNNPQKYAILLDCAKAFNRQNCFGEKNMVTIVDTEQEAIKGCDILLHIEDFVKHKSEENKHWLDRTHTRMKLLAEYVNRCAKRSMILIFNNHGPVCFMASCLIEFCTRLRPCNIVAVTADEGLSMISALSEKTGIPVSRMNGPPVWGFVGIHSFIDESQIVYKADMYRPYKRAATAPEGSTLPLGTVTSKLRLISYLSSDRDELHRKMEEKKEKVLLRLERPVILSKVRALMSLLNLWLADKPSDEIISLGVCSNGSFGIPRGLVFSQPVKMDPRGVWKPYTRLPLINDFSQRNINECLSSISEILDAFVLCRTRYENEDLSSEYESIMGG